MDSNELISRRRFFKKAAKGLLPMLGVYLAAPTVIMSSLSSCGCDGCEAACQNDCEGTCRATCTSACANVATGNTNNTTEPLGDGTRSNPYNVAGLRLFLENYSYETVTPAVYVVGIFTTKKNAIMNLDSGYNKYSGSIADENTASSYEVYIEECEDRSSKEELKKGTKILIYGKLKGRYFTKDSYIVSRNVSVETGCSNCSNTCSSTCNDTCKSTCNNTCSTTCEGTATGKVGTSEADGKVDGYEYVDLGLSVKWARYNMGTTKPEGYGSTYWIPDKGEIYQLIDDGIGRNGGTLSGTQFDNAYNSWSRKWKTPTKSDFEELINNCTYEFISYNGINGGKLTSKKNGKSIFLPATGSTLNLYNGKVEINGKGEYGTYLIGELLWLSSYGCQYEEVWLNNKGIKISKISPELFDYKYSVRPVTTGSSGGGSGCTGSSCSSNCANNTTGSGCSGCGSGCSTSCKTTCDGSCINGCNTLCGGQCRYSCGGTCTYVSAGSKCTGCATSCTTYCYRTCDMACSSSCMSQCIYGSK